jgi:hypothetical protein
MGTGTAQRGTFDGAGGTWTGVDLVSPNNNTIKVVNGVLQ